jgi:ATP-dependent RNA helicase DDX23/PRP28
LDEADKMIDLDLEESVNYIMKEIPNSLDKSDKERECAEQESLMKRGDKCFRTMMMFSATMIPQIEKLARQYLKCPAFISVGEPG